MRLWLNLFSHDPNPFTPRRKFHVLGGAATAPASRPAPSHSVFVSTVPSGNTATSFISLTHGLASTVSKVAVVVAKVLPEQTKRPIRLSAWKAAAWDIRASPQCPPSAEANT